MSLRARQGEAISSSQEIAHLHLTAAALRGVSASRSGASVVSASRLLAMTLNRRLKFFQMGQLFESSLLTEVQHKGVESVFLAWIELWSSVRGE